MNQYLNFRNNTVTCTTTIIYIYRNFMEGLVYFIVSAYIFMCYTNSSVLFMLAHFLGFEFLVRNEENILLSHEKRGKFEESLNSLYLPNLKFYCFLSDNFKLNFQNSRNFLLKNHFNVDMAEQEKKYFEFSIISTSKSYQNA